MLKKAVLVIAVLSVGGCVSTPTGRVEGCALLDDGVPAFDARLHETGVSQDASGCYLEGFSPRQQVVDQQVKFIEAKIEDACGPSTTHASSSPATRGELAGHEFVVAVSGHKNAGTCKVEDVPDARDLDGAAGPSSRYLTPPRYPSSAIRDGVQGQVVLIVLVEAAGDVGAAIVEASSGHAELDEAAVTAAREWRFNPKSREDQPVRSFIRVPVDFTL